MTREGFVAVKVVALDGSRRHCEQQQQRSKQSRSKQASKVYAEITREKPKMSH